MRASALNGLALKLVYDNNVLQRLLRHLQQLYYVKIYRPRGLRRR